MFDFVRKHTKWLMAVMFLLIIPSFVLFGIDGYTRMRETSAVVAKVGAAEITQNEWDNAHKQQTERLRNNMPELDAKLLDSPEAKYALLERLVQEKVLAMAADKSRLQVSDARLARELELDEFIRSLRQPDGKLDLDRYKQMAASQGLTTEGFEAKVRAAVSQRQVEMGIAASGFATPVVANAAMNALLEKRDIQFVQFGPADFLAKVSATDAQLEAYHKENQGEFRAPEKATVEYIVLDLEAIKKGLTLSETDLKTYYEQNAARLSGPEERRASHILISAAKDAPAAEKEKARARAAGLLAELRKNPNSFAEIARKNSQDPGSAAKGGDLDFFGRGAMVKPFEDAAFAMKQGDISGLVVSDFGYHIIKVTEIKAPKTKSFDEMRAGIEADLKTQQAKQKYAELAESFSNGVYEQSDSLKPVADKLKLPIRTAANVGRILAPGMPAELGHAKLLGAIFGPDALEKKRNTEAVEIAPNQMVSARVTSHAPARVMSLEEVKKEVRGLYTAKKALELARAEGEQKLAAWKANPDSATSLPPPVQVARNATNKVPPKVIEASLKAVATALPAWVGVDLGAQGFAVVRVNAVTARSTPDATTSAQEALQVAAGFGSAEAQAYYKMLKERFKVQILAPKPAVASVG